MGAGIRAFEKVDRTCAKRLSDVPVIPSLILGIKELLRRRGTLACGFNRTSANAYPHLAIILLNECTRREGERSILASYIFEDNHIQRVRFLGIFPASIAKLPCPLV